jgi:heme/copper-type cytochrome/quinol oxidase subunit 4
MIKNRTAQIVFQTAFCAIGLIGIIASVGFFDYAFRPDFYVHFTNLSNYLCIAIMFAELVQSIKKKEDDYVTFAPGLKFIGVLAILLTFIVFNLLLAPTREMHLNFKVASIIFHAILPIMYVLDWFLFYERGKVKAYMPLLSISVPLVYVVFIYIRAWILEFNAEVPYIYPYFFLNLETQGVVGVLKWVSVLLIAFIVVGFIFFGLDRLIKSPKED